MNNTNGKKTDPTSSGRALEAAVGDVLQRHRLRYERGWNTRIQGPLKEQITVDFYVLGEEFYVECRRQESEGSANQKSAYIYVKVVDGIYDKPVIVVVEGSESGTMYEFFKERERAGFQCMSLWEFTNFCETIGEPHAAIPKSFDPRQKTMF